MKATKGCSSGARINGVFHHGLIRTWPHTKQTQSITRKVNTVLPTIATTTFPDHPPFTANKDGCLHNAQEITLHQPQQQQPIDSFLPPSMAAFFYPSRQFSRHTQFSCCFLGFCLLYLDSTGIFSKMKAFFMFHLRR